MKLLFKLLRQNLKIGQLVGFLLANGIGALIVLLGIQLFADIDQLVQGEDHVIGDNYLVVSKPVSTVGSFGSLFSLGQKPAFTATEIRAFEEMDPVTSVGRFSSSHFSVTGSISFGGKSLRTEMFLESVPDEFLDKDSKIDWEVKDDHTIPVIVPRNYLALYNYGYASARNMPQVSEGMVSMIEFNLYLSGPGGRDIYKGRVVGFTSRLNTILVPDAFLQSANQRFAPSVTDSPSRIILKVSAKEDSQPLMEHINARGYQVEGPDADSLRLQSLAHAVLYVVMAIGLLVSFLSFYLLLISILLLIEKNKEVLYNLYCIGYSRSAIARPYILMAEGLDVVVWVTTTLIASAIYHYYVVPIIGLIAPGFASHAMPILILSSGLLCCVFLLLHYYSVRRSVRKVCQ